MADEITHPHITISDFDQARIVWRYEILKFLRSKRLIAALALVSVVLALMYLLPILSGDGFNGTNSNEHMQLMSADDSGMDLSEHEDVLYVGLIQRDTIEPDTISLSKDGRSYSSQGGAVWTYDKLESFGESHNAIVFMEEDANDSYIAATYDWHMSAESFDSNFISFVGMIILICAVFFAADSLVGEFQTRTGYLIFPNAIKRSTLFVGKFMASVTMGAVVVALFYAVVAALSLFSARAVDDDFLTSFGFAVGYVFAASGLGYFISSIMKSSIGAIVLTLLLLLIILPIIDVVSMITGTKIEASLTFASGTISYILMDPYPTDSVQDIGAMELRNFYPTPSTAAIVLFAYTVVTCILSAVIFKRKQLAG